MVNLMVRGYLGRTLQFAQRLTVEGRDVDALARKHVRAIEDGALSMIELEFLDEPDLNQRFFRIGTDPGGMTVPMELRPDRKPD